MGAEKIVTRVISKKATIETKTLTEEVGDEEGERLGLDVGDEVTGADEGCK